jgi:ribosomal protein S18 acetylase RimI-like enzyme
MEINIRLARPEEIETIVELQTLSLLNPHSQYRIYDLQQINSLIEGQAAMRHQFVLSEKLIVAETIDLELVGFSSISNTGSHIWGIYVHPDFVRRGIGTKLLRAIETIAIDKKRRSILGVSSIESVDFFQKNGYLILEDMGFYSTDSVWIQCKYIKKELIPLTRNEKNHRKLLLIFSLISSVIITILTLSSFLYITVSIPFLIIIIICNYYIWKS